MNTTTKIIFQGLVASLILSVTAALGADVPPSEPLQPVHFQKIKIDGFWKPHLKRQTEKWIPHCIKQMEAGGQGQELLNIIHAANKLQGKKHGKFNGRPWGDAYIYNTMETMCRMGKAESRKRKADVQNCNFQRTFLPVQPSCEMDSAGRTHTKL